MNTTTKLVVRGRAITEDADGNLCLDDIWEAAGAKATRAPSRWRVTEGAKRLAQALQKKIVVSSFKTNTHYAPTLYAKRGRGNKGTYAHPILAAAYAGYLKPDLEVEVREVWLRYRAGDATLADEILQRATAEANQWAGLRALARSQRKSLTDVLKEHGVEGRGYMLCTDTMYRHLLGAPAWHLRRERGLAQSANMRDHMSAVELSSVIMAESLAAERIPEEGHHGNAACVQATGRSAQFVREAIDRDRKDRQRKIL